MNAAQSTPRLSKQDESGRSLRRTALLDAMAVHLLRHGFTGSPLRALASAAGTSDRMLLYYFVDKDALLTALLQHIAEQLASRLQVDDDGQQKVFPDLLNRLWLAARTPAFEPFMLLFLELAAAAGRGEEPHRTAAGRIAKGFTAWIGDRLIARDEERDARATLLLATLDGLFLLHTAGCETEASAAAASVT